MFRMSPPPLETHVLFHWLPLLITMSASDLVDDNEFCAAWAGEGACEANPHFMTAHCALSCGRLNVDKPSTPTVQEDIVRVEKIASRKGTPEQDQNAQDLYDGVSARQSNFTCAQVVQTAVLPSTQMLLESPTTPWHAAIPLIRILVSGLCLLCGCGVLFRIARACVIKRGGGSSDNDSTLRKDVSSSQGNFTLPCKSIAPEPSRGDSKSVLQTDVEEELKHCLAMEGQSLHCVRKDLEELRERLKSKDELFTERELTLSAEERKLTANAHALREQAGRQEQEVVRLFKRGEQLEIEIGQLRSELQTEREAGSARVRDLHGQLESQRRDANLGILDIEKQHERQLELAKQDTEAKIRDLTKNIEAQRRDANARIVELEVQQELAQNEIGTLQEKLQSALSEAAKVKAAAEAQSESVSSRIAQLDVHAQRLQEQERAIEDRERKSCAEVAAVRGQADSQRQTYFKLVEEVESLRSELEPLRAGAEAVRSLREELLQRSLALDAREEQLGIMERQHAARARKDEAEITALRSQAAAQAESHMKLLHEKDMLREQLQHIDMSICHIRKRD